MLEHGLTFLFTVFTWWLGTGVIILLCALPRRTFGVSLAGATLLLGGACYGLFENAQTMTAVGHYVSFLSAIGVWGWIEMSFLMGFVTGPRRASCPPGVGGWFRFRLALETLAYHEAAILTGAVLVVALTWGAPNQTGTFAFLILMAMRISAKLNIFLGVPNLTDQFLPKHLAYLKSYFRKRRFNPLFPVSFLGALMVACALARQALVTEGPETIGSALLCTLLSLAILEHVFMLLPLPDSALWQWAMPIGGVKAIEKPLP